MMMKAGPTSCALGPNAVGTLDAQHLCTPSNERNGSFSSATIYFPELESDTSQLPSIVLVGGWGCGEKVLAAWAPFLASHGIVAMTIGTPTPWKDAPPARSQALLDASMALQSEHTRAASPLFDRLDVSRRAVMGYSLGGGGAQIAALNDPTLKCSVALCPHDGNEFGVPFPEELSASVPVLILCGDHDEEANSQTQAWNHYRKTTAPKLIFEIKGGDHFTANGPSGGNESEVASGAEPCSLCNEIIASICWGWAPCPWGNYNGPSGHATEEAPRGAVGGVVLAWLQLFLLGEESARERLVARPDIAASFESQKMERR